MPRPATADGSPNADKPPSLPSVTVCIVTHERLHYMRTCLESLRQQTVPQSVFDIVVVDSCGSPATGLALRQMVEALPNARLLRIDRPGISIARNLGAEHARGDFVAYLDDDAIARPDWVEMMRAVIAERHPWPGVLGGRILPVWEQPLPGWWPDSLRGVLSIVEWQGRGEYRSDDLPRGMEPYGVNMAVQRRPLLEIGGFSDSLGRVGGRLLSDEDVQVGWQLQDRGYSAWYDSRVVVMHQIQGSRMTPEWLLKRMYWQGASTVLTRRMLGGPGSVWRELPRRLVVEALTCLAGLLPLESTRLMPLRWRHAYAKGFTRMALTRQEKKRGWPGRALRGLLRRNRSAVVSTLDLGAGMAPRPPQQP